MKVYTPSEFIYAIRDVLHEYPVAIQGEVSDVHTNQGRLVFFELKDENSRVQCFLLMHELARIGIELKDGEEIRVLGHPSLYVRSGGFHVKVKDIIPVGEGALRRAFLALKAKLETEGLFDKSRKRALPRFPETIGLITSSDAAAYTDVLRILKNRYSPTRILHYETRVQGVEAVPQIVEAFEYFNAHPKAADVLILTRGGGSLEDLQAFNHEDVCRAVFSSRIPVVCGVGHERDVTLAELVADRRASTPSNAAECVTPDSEELRSAIDATIQTISHLLEARISTISHEMRHSAQLLDDAFRLRREGMAGLLGSFEMRTVQFCQRLATLQQSADFTARTLVERQSERLNRERTRLNHLTALVQSLSPSQTLARGYTITRSAGKVVHTAVELQPGTTLETQFHDGRVESRVEK
ncbi:MAG: exodeoxyribonuclease VII large subunit [Candidatus Kerfeldbacteria bacterium]|nr:exodeoxyribonuclease VII large subunit [Candidatus Kerfeldbacteria bacterium]